MTETTEPVTEEGTTILTDQGEQTSQVETTEEAVKSETSEETGEALPKAPEKYEFELSDGLVIDDEVVTQFDPVFRELDLTNEQANRLGTVYAEIRKAEAAAWESEVTGWGEAVKADPEIGGDKFAASAANAIRVIGLHGTPELRKFLNETGAGNHPEMVRVFARLGALLPKEDKGVTGETANAPKSIEERMYGKSQP